jgi:pyruvate/2-oxoglutarate dehydrogenase complex dihydrolipoamide acyltransferase (E2) component
MTTLEIRIPMDLWSDDTEGTLLRWLYEDGSLVDAGEPIAEITQEKAQMDLLAPAKGRLRQRLQADATVRRGDLVGHLEP